MPPVSDETPSGSSLPPDPATAPADAVALQSLRREVLTPREQTSPSGNLAVLCSLAGVASGFALIATVAVAQMASPIGAAHRGGHGCGRARVVVVPAADTHPVGFLGVRYTELAGGAAEIKAIIGNSPAAAAGLQPGDKILTAGGELVTGDAELRDIVRAAGAGANLPLTVERAGLVTPLDVTLASPPRFRY